jgi:hypothetical protein
MTLMVPVADTADALLKYSGLLALTPVGSGTDAPSAYVVPLPE